MNIPSLEGFKIGPFSLKSQDGWNFLVDFAKDKIHNFKIYDLNENPLAEMDVALATLSPEVTEIVICWDGTDDEEFPHIVGGTAWARKGNWAVSVMPAHPSDGTTEYKRLSIAEICALQCENFSLTFEWGNEIAIKSNSDKIQCYKVFDQDKKELCSIQDGDDGVNIEINEGLKKLVFVFDFQGESDFPIKKYGDEDWGNIETVALMVPKGTKTETIEDEMSW